MTLIQAMRTDPPAVDQSTSLLEAARTMDAADCGRLPMMDQNSVVGSVTALEILSDAVAHGLDQRDRPVADIMSQQPLACPPETSLDDVIGMMRRHRQTEVLVVEASGRLLGVIDIFGVLAARDSSAAGPMPDAVKRVRGGDA
jgi:CBS domain-containing protein